MPVFFFILAGALVGMIAGEKGYVRIREGRAISSFVSKGKEVLLDFSLHLDDFIYEENFNQDEQLLIYFPRRQIIVNYVC